MADDVFYFEGREKFRNAELITPPNIIKDKVGSGGIDPKVIERAEMFLKENNADFVPIADMYFTMLEDNIQKILKEDVIEDQAFEMLLFPLVQLKSHGTLFQYPIVTEISSMLINFLEVIKNLDKDAIDVIMAHKMTLKAVLMSRIKNDNNDQGRALCDALKEACMRYFKTQHEKS